MYIEKSVYLKIDFNNVYFSSLLSQNCSPVESSRFGSSGNLSQTSSQLSETGQESTGGSELEESFHSYHSAGLHPSNNGQSCTNGHLSTNGHAPVSEQGIRRLTPEVGQGLKNDPPEKQSSKLKRFVSLSCDLIYLTLIPTCMNAYRFCPLYLIHTNQVPRWWTTTTLFPIQSPMVEGH